MPPSEGRGTRLTKNSSRDLICLTSARFLGKINYLTQIKRGLVCALVALPAQLVAAVATGAAGVAD